MLNLLPVPGGLLQSLDDQGGGRGHHGHLGLTVLNGQLNSDLQTLPVDGSLGDVITDLLGGETQGTHLGSK